MDASRRSARPRPLDRRRGIVGVSACAALTAMLAGAEASAQPPRRVVPQGASAARGADEAYGTWSFAPRDRALACEALGRQLRARRPVLAPLLELPEDPTLAERARICGRTIDVLVEAARTELLADEVISVSTRDDPAQRDVAAKQLAQRSKDIARRRAIAASWLEDAASERARRGAHASPTEAMSRVVLAWSGTPRAPGTPGRDAASALVELRGAVARGSVAPGATARLRFALAVLAGELGPTHVPSGLPPLAGNESDFEAAIEVLAWAKLGDELGMRARVEAWLRRTGDGRGGDPTLLGAGLGNADRVYVRALIAIVGDDIDGARAWLRLLANLDDVDPQVRVDATSRLRGLEVLGSLARSPEGRSFAPVVSR